MKMMLAAASAAILMSCAGSASAGIYTDDLTRCVVKSATPADRLSFVRWVFSAMTAAESVSAMSTVTPEQREQSNRVTVALIERLLLVDCRQQTTDALRYDGEGALGASFETLGKVAMADLMGDPAVSAQMEGLAAHLDIAKWEAFVAESKP
jgi:uncharacterized protein involved in copper resistance